MSKRIHVVINPASGKPKPILHTLNRVFRQAGVDWDISLTKESGDAQRFARQATDSGVDVVAGFGGDGTIMEIAWGLYGSQTPMAILPGGTANLMSVELRIPKDLEKAAQIACDEASQVTTFDIGQINDQYFMLRVGLGFAARKVEYADRETKERYGILAYTIAGLKALTDENRAQYRLTLDGEIHEVEGLSCLVDNAGNIGIPGVSPVKGIDISDGLLDVLVITSTAPIAAISTSTSLTASSPIKDVIKHWQAREIRIESDPPQPVQVDGEMLGETPVSVNVIPQAIRVLTPANS